MRLELEDASELGEDRILQPGLLGRLHLLKECLLIAVVSQDLYLAVCVLLHVALFFLDEEQIENRECLAQSLFHVFLFDLFALLVVDQ